MNKIKRTIKAHQYAILLEIKYGKTVTREYFKNINYWAKLTKENSNYILYGGNDTQLRSEVSVLPWKEIEKIEK